MSDNSPARMALIRLASQLPDGSHHKDLVHTKLKVSLDMVEVTTDSLLSGSIKAKNVSSANQKAVLQNLLKKKMKGENSRYLDKAIEDLKKMTGWKPTVDRKTLTPVQNDVRTPYYKMTDGIIGVEQAIESDPLLGKDRALLDAFQKVKAAEDAFSKLLSARYNWD